MLTFTDRAREMVLAFMDQSGEELRALRVHLDGGSPIALIATAMLAPHHRKEVDFGRGTLARPRQTLFGFGVLEWDEHCGLDFMRPFPGGEHGVEHGGDASLLDVPARHVGMADGAARGPQPYEQTAP